MSGIEFRGRRRFRDSDATERLSALLREERTGGGSHAATGRPVSGPAQNGSGVRGAAVFPGGRVTDGHEERADSEFGRSDLRAADLYAPDSHASDSYVSDPPGDVPGVPVPGVPHAGAPEASIPAIPETGSVDDPALWPEPGGSRHREDVTVRRRLSRPALVLLCVVLLVALGAGCVSLLNGAPEDDEVVTTAGASPDGGSSGDGSLDGEGRLRPAGAGASPRASSEPSGRPGSGPGGASGAAGAASGAPGGVVTVHVVGEVKDPSVVTLSPGARVMDAVQAAGGFAPGAVKDRINLAEPVVDGAQIVIPNRSNVDEVLATGAAPGAGARSAGPTPGGSAAGGTSPGGSAGAGAPGQGGAATERTSGTGDQHAPGTSSGALVDLNTASQAELEELPKVGPVLAQRIVEFRTQHGPFTAPEQLDDVSGVGPAMLEALLPLVTV